MCRSFSKVSFAQDNALNEGSSGLCTLLGTSVDDAVIVAKGNDGPKSPSRSGSLLLMLLLVHLSPLPLTPVWIVQVSR